MTYGQATDHGQQTCLILTSDISIGHQIADLIGWHWGQPQQAHDEVAAYSGIIKGKTNVIIADIDAVELGGLALLSYCHHQHPHITTFAITSYHDGLRKRQARELGGCKGFFYLEDESMRIDMTRGLAAQILIGKMLANREITLIAKEKDEGHD